MSAEKLYIEKELSWLSFNERVLQEAADKTVPLIERIRFLGIFSNNLDEFYKVRFADVKRRILINQERGGSDNSKRLLSKMQAKALKLNEQFDELYSELIRKWHGVAFSWSMSINSMKRRKSGSPNTSAKKSCHISRLC
ncbi:polyphosphate kinase [Vibrio parahaemolyticus]|nr:polyphosphate kinase [Vibrio parahaemolyticus]